jgi:hypothetical protein
MPRVGFAPTIPVFERAKTFRALGRAATITCSILLRNQKMHQRVQLFLSPSSTTNAALI